MPKRQTTFRFILALLFGLPLMSSADDWPDAGSGGTGPAPQPVSPGAATASTLITEACPTFSWGAIAGAQRYELQLFDAHWNPSTDAQEQAATAAPLHRIAIDAPASAWTPAGEQCLQDGAAYVWFVRAETAEGFSPWSPGAGFQIDFGVDALSQAVRRELAIQLQQPAVWRDVIQQVLTSNSALGLSTPLIEPRSATSVTTATQEDASTSSTRSRAIRSANTPPPTPRAAATSFPNPSALKTTGPNGVVLGGTYEEGGIPAEGAGTRLMWYPGKAALRAGEVTGTQWDDASVGPFSFAAGFNSTASGWNSTAMGISTSAIGRGSTALGEGTTANGQHATALGYLSTAGYNYSTAMGYVTTAAGRMSTAMGQETTAQSFAEVAIGSYNALVAEGSFNPSSWSVNDRLFVIGIGTSDEDRKNGLVLDKLGSLTIARNAYKPGGGNWLATSDSRLKEITGPYRTGLEAITALDAVRFRYKPNNARGHDSGPTYVGFIAQEVQQAIPEAVREGADGYLDFDMHAVNVALVNAVKELKARNDGLTERLTAESAKNQRHQQAYQRRDRALQEQVAALKQQLLGQQAQIASLRNENARLSAVQARLADVEAALALMPPSADEGEARIARSD